FDLQQVPVGKLKLDSLELEPFPVAETQTKYDLRFNLQENDLGIRGQIEYSTGAFERSTIERMAGHFLQLLHATTSDPDGTIGQFPLMSERERLRTLQLGEGQHLPPSESTLHGLFEKSVRSSPNTIAVFDGPRTYSYKDLADRANAFADQIRQLNLPPDSRIGACLPKSIDLIAALFGILKAGAAYVPLDPDYPSERLDYILKDAQCSAIFETEKGHVHLRPIETEPRESFGEPTPLHQALAYVIYTSGSTGQPKGVAIDHAAATTMVRWACDHFLDDELSGVLASTSICFDLSVFEIFVPLATGGGVVLAENLLALPRLPAKDRVSLINTVPSLMRQLLHEGPLPVNIHTVNLAGEALPADLVKAIQAEGVTHIYNLYGPSEDTTYSTWTALHPGAFDPDKEVVTIGKPVDNTVAYVLDPKENLQPIGVAGELYLGGDKLARGYLDRPTLTSNAFLENPVAATPPRIYRTGDRVRMLPNGNLEFLGRADEQFKIRGFRIEAGEIESKLRAHSDVEDALVVAHKEEHESLLLAYVVASGEDPAPDADLRTYLSGQLPSAMVPSLWQRLPSLPRLPNGKVDRSKLPQPEKPKAGATYTAPRTDTEKRLVSIWQTTLKRDRIGIDDNFFEIGGHSLLAIQLVTQVEIQFGQALPLRQLFVQPTVAQLAAILDQSTEKEPAPPTDDVRIEPDPSSRFKPFPLTDIQQAYWIGRNSAFDLGNIATHGYREIDVTGISHSAINRAFNQLIERHEMLRAIVDGDGMQKILAEVPPYEIDLNPEPPDGADSIRRRLSHQVFATDTWPLFHIEAVAISPETTRYCVSFDVLLGDAWSLQVLGRETATLLLGQDLPPLDLSFRDYVLAKEVASKGEKAKSAWAYWEEKIPNLPPAPELPLIKSPSEVVSPKATRRSGRLSAERWQSLKTQTRETNLTASGVVLAAFTEVLGTWSRRRQFTINLTLFDRPQVHPDIENIVGDFTSSTLVSCDPGIGTSFSQQAADLQANLWEALDHRAVSGVRIIRELARRQQSGNTAVMPVVFTSTLGKMTGSTRSHGWNADVVYGLSQTSQVYLDHQVSEIDGELVLNWDCVEELWPPGVLDTMFAAYLQFLETLADEPAAWKQSPVLGGGQSYQQKFNVQSEGQEVRPALLHQLFFERTASHPDAPAILSDGISLSYIELARRANSVAATLSNRQVSPNELIAVCADKGPEQIIACLGILTAGAAYVPVNSSLPKARRHQLVEDTGSKVVLTSGEGINDWPDSVESIEIPAAGSFCEVPSAPPPPRQSVNDLAYVIYTSGSTGSPKGVMIDHRGATNTVLDLNQRIDLRPEDRIFAISSLGFDLSVYDIFGALAAGAAIIIGSREDRQNDPAYWLDLAKRHCATVWNSVPALARLLVDGMEASLPQGLELRAFLLSGDWIPLPLPDAIATSFPEAEIFSLGGATEASIWSIIHPINQVDPSWPSIPYGKPLTGQTWYVLDENLRPCPPWVPGELYIGGIGVAQGYWNQPALSAERFLPDPFSKFSHTLYRTGDWGRLRSNVTGEPLIEFLGREDLQVKINGYRIELGEIEAALQNHPNVEQAAVTAFGDPPELAAFVVPAAGGTNLEAKAELAPPPGFDAETIVDLPSGTKASLDFQRQSYRRFSEDTIPLELLAKLLGVLAAHPVPNAPFPKFRYPSAGSLYPVSAIIGVRSNRVDGCDTGWFRYDPHQHQLGSLTSNLSPDDSEPFPVNASVHEASAFVILLIADLARIEPTYGDRAREFCQIEAGYIGQLLMETAPGLTMGLCPVNERSFESLPSRLGLSESHGCVHGFLAGAIRPDWKEQWTISGGPSFQSQLEAHLQKELPRYMVPRHFQILQALPLSANGKVDRKALALPNLAEGTTYIAPTNDLERTITTIWSELLGADKVGIHDDFFQLGGNSLLAIQLLGRLRTACHPGLTMAQLFGALTPAAQAELVQSLDRENIGQLDTITRTSRTDDEDDEDDLDLDQLTDEEVDERLRDLLDD
ncbi:MAG: amino acid adenylation domain-containing protein, partial [Verrucomicrobiota bacterium]